ncbi:MAG: hypothetical protein ABL933_03305 [Methyloglobulus sp.]|nr:hypothetical protein [Methyloglobulus sp.]
MKSIVNTVKLFYQSRYGKPFVLAFLGYCWVAIFLSPELTWEEIDRCRFLWNLILNFDPMWLRRFEVHHLAWYFPIKLICFLGFPAIMGANLAAFFDGQSSPGQQIPALCWVSYPHPQPFYPEILETMLSNFYSVIATTIGIFIVVGACLNKMLHNKIYKIHVCMLVAIVVSVLAAMFLPDLGFQHPGCRLAADLEREMADYQLVIHDLPIFITHFNPVFAFLFSYVGVSIMMRVIPALMQSISKLRASHVT